MSKISSLLLICLLLAACAPGFLSAPATATATAALPTFTAAVSLTPRPTRTPIPSTATASLTPTPAPTQDLTGPAIATANTDAPCWAGPTNEYPLVVQLSAGQSVPIIGKVFAQWIVQPEGMAKCWVDAMLVTVRGATFSLPDFITPPSSFAPAAPIDLKRTYSLCKFIDPTIGFEIEYIITWTDNSSNEDGFYIYRDANRVAELPANVTHLTDAFIIHSGGHLFQYYVVAYNKAGRGQGVSVWFRSPCG
jgi:hypothetical protein